MAEGLKVAPRFTLPLDLVTEATAIVATRGAGKSSASAVIVEEAHALGVQTVIFDRTGVYWGLQSNAAGTGPGLPIYVLGGAHHDVTLEASAGAMIADLVVDSGHSFVLDLSDFSKAHATRFAADFLERIYDRKARARTTTLLVLDEAHFYAPQTPRGGFRGDGARLMGAMEDVVGLGRSRGLGVVLTTQRTQSLNKAVLDLIETLFVMRMLSPRARDAVKDWIQEKHEDDEQGVLASLDNLETGTAWVWSPLRGILRKIDVRRIQTFNSYATPKPGEIAVEPTVRRELDLTALGEQIAATVERAKAEDPNSLKDRIRELEALTREQALRIEKIRTEQREPERVEVPAISEDQRAWLEAYVEDLAGQTKGLTEMLGRLSVDLDDVKYGLADVRIAESKQPAVRPMPKPNITKKDWVDQHRVGLADQVRAAQNGQFDGEVSGPQRKMLIALAQHGQTPTSTLATLTNYSAKGSAFRNPLSNLNARGLVTRVAGNVEITREGLEALGEYEPLPTGSALLAWWKQNSLKGPEVKIVEALESHGPADSVETLAEWAEYSALGSAFRNPLSHLRSLGLVTPAREFPIDLVETVRD